MDGADKTIREIALSSLNLLFSCVHFQAAEFEQKATKGTKSRSSPRPLFLPRPARDLELVETASLPSVKWLEGLSWLRLPCSR
jgi:hypothetical protein